MAKCFREKAGPDVSFGSDQDSLTTRFVQGDSCAFDEIVAIYQLDVTRLAYRIIGWQDGLVEDIVQEVFLAALRNRTRFRRQSSLKTWLMRITVNKCRSVRRKRLLRLKLLSNTAAETKLDAKTAGQNLIDREKSAQVHRAVGRLPRRLREVTVLRYLEEMALDEIADVLNISHNAVEVRLNRARKQLKSKLAQLIEE